MTTNRHASVWDAIEDNPHASTSMKARSALMMELSALIQKREMTQAEAADWLGVTQPRISDLMRGKINLFSLDMLVDMAALAGMAPTVQVSSTVIPPQATARHAPAKRTR